MKVGGTEERMEDGATTRIKRRASWALYTQQQSRPCRWIKEGTQQLFEVSILKCSNAKEKVTGWIENDETEKDLKTTKWMQEHLGLYQANWKKKINKLCYNAELYVLLNPHISGNTLLLPELQSYMSVWNSLTKSRTRSAACCFRSLP